MNAERNWSALLYFSCLASYLGFRLQAGVLGSRLLYSRLVGLARSPRNSQPAWVRGPNDHSTSKTPVLAAGASGN